MAKLLTVKQQAFTIAMYTPGSESYGNGTESARAAQYKGNTNTLKVMAHKLITNGNIIRAKQAIQAETSEKMEHNRDIAIKLLTENLTALTVRVDNGDVGAIQARTAVIRELNAISNLHSSTLHTEQDVVQDITEQQAQTYRDMAAAANREKISISKETA